MKNIFKLLCALAGLHLGACAQGNVKSVNVEDFTKCIEQPNVQLLDVRTAEEFAEGFIASRNGGQCLNIDVKRDDFMEKAKAMLDKSKPVAVYCRTGRRSMNAALQLDEAGYQVVNLKGGITGWQSAGMEVVTSQTSAAANTYKDGAYTVDFAVFARSFVELDQPSMFSRRRAERK